MLTAPLSLSDVVTDGFITQAGIDDALEEKGTITSVEFNEQDDGYEVIIHLHNGLTKSTEVFHATTVATINAERTMWEWREEPRYSFLGSWPSNDMIRAARTLFGNGPCYLVPTKDGSFDAAVIDPEQLPAIDPRTALCVGLATLSPDADIRRAVIAFSAIHQLSIHVDDDLVTFSDGTVVDVAQGKVQGALTYADVVADSFFLATEHQMFFEANFPRAVVSYSPKTNSATINNMMTAHAQLVGTIVDDQWRWSRHPQIRNFAVFNGISEFFIPSIPVEQAAALAVDCAAKRIVKHWTHTFVALEDNTTALIVLDAPQLHLPPAHEGIKQQVLATPVPDGIDRQRAINSYRQLRG